MNIQYYSVIKSKISILELKVLQKFNIKYFTNCNKINKINKYYMRREY